MRRLDDAGVFTKPDGDRTVSWIEHLRVRDLSVGTYSIPVGAADTQTPHTEDEIYVVTQGSATFEAAGQRVAATAGTVLFVPANEPHRFVDVTDDLAVIVIFGPAEYSRATG